MADGVRDNEHDGGRNNQLNIGKCKTCGVTTDLKLCARCKRVSYCCKGHQRADWTYHKKICKKSMERTKWDSSVVSKVKNLSLDDEMDYCTSASSERAIAHSVKGESLFTGIFRNGVSGINTNNTLSKETETNETDLVSGSSENYILESEESVLHAPDYTASTLADQFIKEMPVESNAAYLSILESRNKVLSEYVTKCLNAYGVCVIDNFLGDSKGTDILDEVIELHECGELSSGQLVNAAAPKGTNIRDDLITWVDGTELGCGNINFLISSIDAIMIHCQRTLEHYSIKGRSKAMVAVYPGKSTGFLRHIDNPSGDGRCVTCIYYINKGWNSKVDGGLLRIFPDGQNKVANVEPKFDRLLFFWSDRRNPHEVLPAFKSRYAVTVWYYDEEERRKAVKQFKGRSVEKKHVYPLTTSILKS